MTDLDSLIEELEKAEEGSRGLSDGALLAAGWTRKAFVHPGLSADYGEEVECWDWTLPNGEPCPRHHMGGLKLPSPTESIDDAIALAPPGHTYHLEGPDQGLLSRTCAFGSIYPIGDGNNSVGYFAETGALALCIAALRARQQMAEESHD